MLSKFHGAQYKHNCSVACKLPIPGTTKKAHKKRPRRAFSYCLFGGGLRIRTLGGDKPSTVFKTAAFDRSASPPETFSRLPVLRGSRNYTVIKCGHKGRLAPVCNILPLYALGSQFALGGSPWIVGSSGCKDSTGHYCSSDSFTE